MLKAKFPLRMEVCYLRSYCLSAVLFSSTLLSVVTLGCYKNAFSIVISLSFSRMRLICSFSLLFSLEPILYSCLYFLSFSIFRTSLCICSDLPASEGHHPHTFLVMKHRYHEWMRHSALNKYRIWLESHLTKWLVDHLILQTWPPRRRLFSFTFFLPSC